MYTHEEFFKPAVQIWTQTKARKIVTAYNEEDWLPAESYEKEWGANMRSTPEGQIAEGIPAKSGDKFNAALAQLRAHARRHGHHIRLPHGRHRARGDPACSPTSW